MLILRRRIAILALAIASSFVTIASGTAQVACYGPQLPVQTIADFIANPAPLLNQIPNARAEMISKIRDLVASNPATLPVILDLIGTASPAQIDAIRTGLGHGALPCARTDQAYAIEIQQAVSATKNDELTLAFAAVLGYKPIGAGGGGGGGGGGPTNPLFGDLADLAVHRGALPISARPITRQTFSPCRALLPLARAIPGAPPPT
jgi:hypothetical protein